MTQSQIDRIGELIRRKYGIPSNKDEFYTEIKDLISFLQSPELKNIVKDEWISVEERLPEKVDMYLVQISTEDMGVRTDACFYCIREYGSMACEKTGWGKPRLYDFNDADKITHWMPLPYSER